MKINKLSASTLFAIVFLTSSCLNDQPDDTIIKWKTCNEAYFNNMKDSMGYTFYSIPGAAGNLGYYYKIITPGDPTSTSPLATDSVTVNYKGSLITDVVFDKSYTGASPLDNNTARPVSFIVNQLIGGKVFNLTQMKVGEIRKIVLPQELGYGGYNIGGVIPAFSTTRFDIQLISVKH